mmetsp:Transcript_33757/g.88707  ORF Transcript_33757/g.88707 Transcript_33757/m.88707 type:complete len:132 (-) Transcript_33757:136-531(-)
MADEVAKAAIAAVGGSDGGDTIFGKIIRREIRADIVYEDDACLVFKDINPQAPVHLLAIPKKKIKQLSMADESDAPILGHLLTVASKLGRELPELSDGFRIVINDGKHGAQTVYHLHVHILGGRQLKWPPG